MTGTLFIVAAPSGAGKSSLVNALLEREPGMLLSISHTTRAPRPGEEDDRHYHFVNRGVFEQLVARDAFLEHAEVFGNLYGTAREMVEEKLRSGRDVLLEIDWQGARQVRAKLPCVSIFILPPSREELARRLRTRAQDSEAAIARRSAEARKEISHHAEFDFLIVNDDFAAALADLRAIVTCQRLRCAAQRERYAALIDDLLGAS
jgi:guanylate kinase